MTFGLPISWLDVGSDMMGRWHHPPPVFSPCSWGHRRLRGVPLVTTSQHTAAGMKIVLNHNIQLDSIERVNCQGHEKSRIRYWGLNNIFTHMWIVEKTETEYGSVNFNRNIYCIVIIPTRFLPIITSDRLGREWDLTYLLGPWAGSLQWNCRVLYFII